MKPFHPALPQLDVSDHAVVRWLERVCGVDIEKYRDEIRAAFAAGGIAVDAALRTSAPDVYAAGDVAAHDHPRHEGRVRVEHWSNAKDQGTHVAGNLLGGHDAYGADPYFFSDQYDLGCEYRGLADPAHDELVLRGDPDSREFLAFWRRDGRVTAALNVNLWDHGDALTALVGTRARVSARELAEADLNTLTTAGAADRR